MRPDSFEGKIVKRTIYHFEINQDSGVETAVHPIHLLADGTLDMSAVPEGLSAKWNKYGILDALGRKQIYPKDGERFLFALLRLAETNPYQRFRE